MNKLLIFLTLALGIILLILWVLKKNKFSKCNKSCKVVCPASEDDYKKVKDIQLTKCQACENYCESSKSNGCCPQCQQGLVIGLKNGNHSHCSQGHFHHHHHHEYNCHLEHSNIQHSWIFWLIPLLIAAIAYPIFKKLKLNV